MASLSTDYKYSFGYTASITGESSTRSLSGLNIRTGSNVEIGPAVETLVGSLYETINSFSNGTISNGRFISERSVTF